MIVILLLLVLSILDAITPAISADQHPLADGRAHRPESDAIRPYGGLKGRFLHITDFHVDRYYMTDSSCSAACHRGQGHSGYFGTEGSDCDSPVPLANETLRWIEENVKGSIDFVVWTGDTARHDRDSKIPRTEDEVFHLQELLTDGLVRTFKGDGTKCSNGNSGSLSVPIVPTVGNNDVMPHNIFKPGPNKWTTRLLDAWRELIPEAQRHTFARGGWFAAEVIPGKLAVISLNTLYFFDSNSAVDGCMTKSEPGYEHMEWLRVQLKLLRDRGMKAILIGHVPPARTDSKQNWDETCWQKYNLWLHQYRDTVIGSLYGHMNIDHFLFQDSEQVKVSMLGGDNSLPRGTENTLGASARSRTGYLTSLRDQWSKFPSPFDDLPPDYRLPRDDATTAGKFSSSEERKKHGSKNFWREIGGPWAERYSASLVSPSVVPSYYPTLRIIEYNITGLENVSTWAESEMLSCNSEGSRSPVIRPDMPSEEATDRRSRKGKKKPSFKIPDPPSPSAPPGPAYSNQPFTWLGYTQYYANLTKINSQVARLRKSSAKKSTVAERDNVDRVARDAFHYEVEYNTMDDETYGLKDLTVSSLFHLALLIGKTDPIKVSASLQNYGPGHEVPSELIQSADVWPSEREKENKNQTWLTFLMRAFVGFFDVDELDGIE